MNDLQALDILHQLVEQSMAGGFFKDFATLDTARAAHAKLRQSVNELQSLKTKQDADDTRE